MDATALSKINGAGSSGEPSAPKVRPDAAAQLDYNAFLQLLIAQMQNASSTFSVGCSGYLNGRSVA